MAVSPIIEAEDTEISYAISTIFLYNIIGVLAFPVLGLLFGMDQLSFGLWAGTAVTDTSSVVAAGYAFGEQAGSYATIVKLTRTLMLIPVSISLAIMRVWRNQSAHEGERRTKIKVAGIFPWFILWFLLAVCLNTFGYLPSLFAEYLPRTGKFLIVIALVAVGLRTKFACFAETGWKPLLLGFTTWALLCMTSFWVISFIL